MKTPKNYVDHVKKNEITKEMLKDCLLSVDKRAQNCRKKGEKYREDRFNYIHAEKDAEMYFQKEEEYNKFKAELLNLLKPLKIYWFEYADYDLGYPMIYKTNFLYFEILNIGFHSLVDYHDFEYCDDLEEIDIETPKCLGEEIENLISVQFVKKVLALIRTNDYVLI